MQDNLAKRPDFLLMILLKNSINYLVVLILQMQCLGLIHKFIDNYLCFLSNLPYCWILAS